MPSGAAIYTGLSTAHQAEQCSLPRCGGGLAGGVPQACGGEGITGDELEKVG